MRDVASTMISHEDSITPSLLFSNFGCCISKGSYFQIICLNQILLNRIAFLNMFFLKSMHQGKPDISMSEMALFRRLTKEDLAQQGMYLSVFISNRSTL